MKLPSRIARSFRAKVVGAAILTTCLALLLALSMFFFRQWPAERRDMVGDNTVAAQVIAENLAASLVFRDPEDARQILGSARAIPDFASAHLFDAEGRLFAELGERPSPVPRATGTSGPSARYWPESLEVHVPVKLDGARVGELVMVLGLTNLNSLLRDYVVFTLMMLALVGTAAALMAFIVCGKVIEPVHRLSRAMGEVRRNRDFTRRVEHGSEDELGQLTDDFNALLETIDGNDRDLRRTMDELVEARDLAEKASLMKSQFLANMSHEIRTPLNGVLGMAQVMARARLPEAQRRQLDVIRSSGQGLLSLLNDLLDLSKIEAGRFALECVEFDLDAAVRAAVDPFAAVAASKGLAFTIEIDEAARGCWLGDGARVRQIVSNLVANAVKFTRAGQVCVAVGVEPSLVDEVLTIAVSDTGVGVAADKLPQLFDKFAQADASTTREFGGTGLGLSICRELARMMEGEVAAESVEGEGSTFRVRLPLRRARVPAAQAHQSIASARARPLEAGDAPIRILVAEDNATNQLVISAMLEPLSVSLQIAGDGAKAVEAWSQAHFDLVLMDIQMPVMDGVEAARRIRLLEGDGKRPRTPIVALTANAMKHQVEEYLAAGMDGHVAKPIETEVLYAVLDKVLANLPQESASACQAAGAGVG